MAVESIPWTYEDSTRNITRELRHENCKIFQKIEGDNSYKTLTIASLRFTKLKRILLSFKNWQSAFQNCKMCHYTIAPHGGSTRILY